VEHQEHQEHQEHLVEHLVEHQQHFFSMLHELEMFKISKDVPLEHPLKGTSNKRKQSPNAYAEIEQQQQQQQQQQQLQQQQHEGCIDGWFCQKLRIP